MAVVASPYSSLLTLCGALPGAGGIGRTVALLENFTRRAGVGVRGASEPGDGGSEIGVRSSSPVVVGVPLGWSGFAKTRGVGGAKSASSSEVVGLSIHAGTGSRQTRSFMGLVSPDVSQAAKSKCSSENMSMLGDQSSSGSRPSLVRLQCFERQGMPAAFVVVVVVVVVVVAVAVAVPASRNICGISWTAAATKAATSSSTRTKTLARLTNKARPRGRAQARGPGERLQASRRDAKTTTSTMAGRRPRLTTKTR